MKFCVIIPCFNHPTMVAAVTQAAKLFFPVIVVDDGSTQSLPELPGCEIIRLERNSGKGSALRAGFQRAVEVGFTHAITMDADGQHFAEDLPKFLAAAQTQPEALIVGVRDFFAAGCPTHRRRSNAVSTFWFRVETGVRLPDTQCGFRCYPLALTQRLKPRSGRYAFELEFMVRASWTGVPIVAVPVKCTYAPDQIRQSHFRPVRDLAHITLMNIGLVLQSWFVPLTLRIAWSHGEKWSLRKTVREFFAEHTEKSSRLAAAVGLGLFFGILPIYGFQIMVGAAVAHQLRLNKATLLLASHISIPPVVPFILYGSMVLGHWLFTGQSLDISPHQITKGLTLEHFVEWIVGSVALGVAVGLVGTILTYSVARLVRRK
jgi:glycosyltransferase involved in cell wall biosynthesis